MAFAAAVTLVAAAVWVSRQRLDMSAYLSVVPPRTSPGPPVQARLELANKGARRSPAVVASVPLRAVRPRAPVAGSATALLGNGPLEPGGTASAVYRLPTTPRGIWNLGPVQVRIGDPFGLAERAWHAEGACSFVVHPKVVRLDNLRVGAGGAAGGGRSRWQAPRGEELDGMRDFVAGDDLRLVHWKATAKRDRLTVRQDAGAAARSITVLLDLREASHPPGTVETCLEAATSIVVAALSVPGQQVVLATTAGPAAGPAPGRVAGTALLDLLASADLHDGPGAALPPGAVACDLFIVVAPSVSTGLELARYARRRPSQLLVVATTAPPAGQSPATTSTDGQPGGRPLTVLRTGANLQAAWAALLASGLLEAGGRRAGPATAPRRSATDGTAHQAQPAPGGSRA